LALDWPRKEVVVVDDGSTDRSLDVIKSYGDRIKYVSKEKRRPTVCGQCRVSVTSGELVYVLVFRAGGRARLETVRRQAEIV